MSYMSLQAENEAKAPPADRWKMPRPKSGLVRWKPHGENQQLWYSGVILKDNGISLDLYIFPVGLGRPLLSEGAKHVSDPSLKRIMTQNPGGVWEFTEHELAAVDLERRVAELEKQLT